MVKKRYDFNEIEKTVFAFWKENKKIIDDSIFKNPDKPSFTFLEGPPTANAPPALHHVECRVFKDLFCRFKHMHGFTVARKGGWDCHGLPVEVQVEKKLGLSTKKEVLDYGVDKFVDECKKDVFSFVKEWTDMTERMAFWVDLENPYMTLNIDFMESVWWSLKELFNKDLLYEGHKVVPYCPRCETPLSSHEVAQGYKDIEEDTVTVEFKLTSGKYKGKYVLAWTTTPWTLKANMALAVHPEVDYVLVKDEERGKEYILAKDLVSKYYEEPEVLEEFKGKELELSDYEPLWDYYVGKVEGPIWKVILADYVTTEEGTGVVHQASAFGEDDYLACKEYGLSFINPVGKDGNYTEDIPEYEGRFVKDCDQDIIKQLEREGKLIKTQKYEHTYPFCWRCKSPLIYYAMDSWFVGVSKHRETLLKNNEKISWYPEHIKEGRFGNWLEGAKDWALSRNKFWGTPLPIWKCDSEECDNMVPIGSRDELKEKSIDNTYVEDLHLPTVDKVKIKCEKCGSEMSRTPEVIDCWYDSGAASFAQFHYPFENKEEFDNSFPYGFIAEAIDQTRGWFYTLHVLGSLLFDKPAYMQCAVAGHICDDKGEKMSKSKGNIVVPNEIFDKVGVDAVRMLMASYSLGNAIRFGEDPLNENVMPFFNTLWNSYYYMREFMKLQDIENVSTADLKKLKIEDKWIMSRINTIVKEVEEHMEKHEYNHSISKIQYFVINDLSRWYIKLIRERAQYKDMELAYAFKYVFDRLVKVMAPFTPYISEFIYLQFTKTDEDPQSVHQCMWPTVDENLNERLETDMANTQDIVQAIFQARDYAQVGNRWPLADVQVLTNQDDVKVSVAEFEDLIKTLTNVKGITFVDKFEFIDYAIKPDFKGIGADFGTATGDVLNALKEHSDEEILNSILNEGKFVMKCTVTEGEEIGISKGEKVEKDIELGKDSFTITKSVQEPWSNGSFKKGEVFISKELTPELEEEGYAREVLRRVQVLRKDAEMEKSDRVALYIGSDVDMSDIMENLIKENKDKIGAETIEMTTKMEPDKEWPHGKLFKIKKREFGIYIEKL